MGATFSRVKNWAPEILTNTDLNAEIDNILNNLGPAGVDDYSTTTAQMKLQTSPGGLGSESLATSLAGEIERLRYVIQRMIGSGVTYWYQSPPSTFTDLVAALGAGLPTYRIVSGKTTGNSSQLCALIPAGNGLTVSLTASSATPFVYYINGTQYSVTASIALPLSAGPSTNQTATLTTLQTTNLAQWTKFWGEYNTTINVVSMATTFAAATDTIQAFQNPNGNEIFLGYINSTTAIINAMRGFMFNSVGACLTPAGLENGDKLKLMKLTWIFANTNSSLAVTYNQPSVGAVQPSSPATGDYWFDTSTTAWKSFNSTSWIDAAAILIGICAQNETACMGARTFDAYKSLSGENSIQLRATRAGASSATTVYSRSFNSRVDVFGTLVDYKLQQPSWNLSTDLDSGLSISVGTNYYFYVKESGRSVVSDVVPASRPDLKGLYHPGEMWRCVGYALLANNTAFNNVGNVVHSFREGSGVSETQLMGDAAAYRLPDGTTSSYDPSVLYSDRIKVTGISQAVWAAGNGTWWGAATLSLTPGAWRITVGVNITCTTTPAYTLLYAAVSTASGNTNSVLGAVTAWESFQAPLEARSIVIPCAYVGVSSLDVGTTGTREVYVKVMGNTVSTAFKVDGGYMHAERLDALNGAHS